MESLSLTKNELLFAFKREGLHPTKKLWMGNFMQIKLLELRLKETQDVRYLHPVFAENISTN